MDIQELESIISEIRNSIDKLRGIFEIREKK